MGINFKKVKLKNFFWLISFALFLGATFWLNTQEKSRFFQSSFSERQGFVKGLSVKDLKRVKPVNHYKIKVFYDDTLKKIFAKEKIVWKNSTSFPTNEIYFHLYANAYKSNKTIFASAYFLDKEARTYFDINSFKINGVKSDLEFVQPDVPNPHDSTVAKVTLPFEIKPKDSVEIYFEFALRVPKSVKRFGYAPGTDFALVSQWFPKPGVFENGKWVCHQYFPHLNFYSDFADFEVEIETAKDLKIVATGVREKVTLQGRKKKTLFVQRGVHDFAWAVSREAIDTVKYFVGGDKRKIKTELFIYPTDEKYIDRIFNAVFNSYSFYEKNLFPYPYEKLTIVNVPPTSRSGGMEYPTLITVSASLFSPIETHQPEKLVIHEFTHQFFYSVIANNETEEAWLDEGFTSYFSSKIVEQYYGKRALTFKFLDFIPVYGLNYLSFSDIPVVYSLGVNYYPEYALALKQYYRNLRIGSIADASYLQPNRLAYAVNAYSKPEIMLTVLERMLGEKEFFGVVKKYGEEFKFRHPKGEDFWNVLLQKHPNLKWFKEEVFNSSKIFDDKIRYVRKVGKNEYELFAERLHDGYFPHKIAVYTTADTIYLNWNEKGKYKIFRFTSPNEVVAADLDPKKINLFDLNFANNSYTIAPQYWGKFSLSLRWFFWLQNALMILGSAG